MYYEKLAEEFIDIRSRMIKLPQNQQIYKAMQGEKFVLDYLIAHGEKAYPKELSRVMSVSSARIACILNHMEEKELVAGNSIRKCRVQLHKCWKTWVLRMPMHSYVLRKK